MMAYDPGALESSLSAAVGGEPLLIAELRGAFFDGASAHVAVLQMAETESDWRDAAQRLRGLAASFGARRLMDAASEAMAHDRRAGDLRRIERAIAALSD